MGAHENIGHDAWPEQGRYLGLTALVAFGFDTSRVAPAIVVRDDKDAPGHLVLQLLDGTHRVVLAAECQWRPVTRDHEAFDDPDVFVRLAAHPLSDVAVGRG